MNTFNKIFMAVLIISISQYALSKNNPDTVNKTPNTIPAIHEWSGSTGFFEITNDMQITVDSANAQVAETFAEDLQSLSGEPRIKVCMQRENNSNNKSCLKGFKLSLNKDQSLGEEGYSIEIADEVIIRANEQAGLFYGTQTLLQIVAQDGTAFSRIPKGSIRDIPLIKERSFMLDIGRKYFEMDYLKKTIRNLAWYKYNRFHMHFTDWSGFRLKSEKFPGLASEQAYSKKDIRKIQDYAKKYNVMIIPEIDLPAHSTHIIKYRPDLAFQCKSMRTGRWLTQPILNKRWGRSDITIEEAGWVLDITKPHVRKFITELLDEFIPLFDSPYFHIGGDEWQFDKQKFDCPELMAYTKEKGFEYPGDTFVDWINSVNKQVKSYGKTTQIWNWWRYEAPTKNEFNKTSLQPDRDILVIVWNKSQEKQILHDGYQINISTEEGEGALYTTPGLRGRKLGDNAFFDNTSNYEELEFVSSPKIRGYTYCLWTDRLEHMNDEWFDRPSDKPKAIVAERTWGKKGSKTVEGLYIRMLNVGLAPHSLQNK